MNWTKLSAATILVAALIASPATAHADCGDPDQPPCTGPVPTVDQVVAVLAGLTDPDIPAANKTDIVTPGFSPDEAGTIDDHLHRWDAFGGLLPPDFAVTDIESAPRGQTLPNVKIERRLLFPGSTPRRAIDPEHFANRLKQRGIRPRAGRNTALIQLASDLPAAVLSDILGIDIVTATRWAGYAKRDWQSYLAIRRETAQ
jgi:hypothetical protein